MNAVVAANGSILVHFFIGVIVETALTVVIAI